MTSSRQAELQKTADALMNARRTGELLSDLPPALVPQSLDEVYAVQDIIAPVYGPVGGWKIGAPSLEATPLFAPMPAAWIAPDGATLSAGAERRLRGLEAEIAFLVGTDLPPRLAPYTRDEVMAAMASCHPAIEELESAFVDPAAATRFAMFADLQMHGGFVYGPAIPNWQAIDWHTERVTLAVDGVVRVERTGSNTSGDLLRLLPYLANEGAARTGGLKRGQWITTGSWTGNEFATAGSAVDVNFATARSVHLRFA